MISNYVHRYVKEINFHLKRKSIICITKFSQIVEQLNSHCFLEHFYK